jgi:3-methylcrotonyl-CoA carboxylase alpha subunit
VLTYLHDGALHLQVTQAAAKADTAADSVAQQAPFAVQGVLSFASTPQGIAIDFTGQRCVAVCHAIAHAKGSEIHVFTAQAATKIIVIDLFAHAGEAHAEGGRLTAPMPGKVVSFAVKVGDKVKSGQALAVMDAMKMEHTIAAPRDGTVAELLYAPGDQVAEGAELLTLAV